MKAFGFMKGRVFRTVVLLFGLLAAARANAQLRDQLNLVDHDSKPFYLGIGFMYEQSHLQVSAHPKFLQSDSVL
jgi:hypothetical protein